MPRFDSAATAPHAEQAVLEQAFAETEAPTRSDRGKWARLLALVGSQLFDAATTDAVLKRGGRELNPLLEPFAGNTAALYGTKVGGGLLTALLLHKVATRRPTLANVMGAGVVGLNTAVGVRNLRQR